MKFKLILLESVPGDHVKMKTNVLVQKYFNLHFIVFHLTCLKLSVAVCDTEENVQ